MCNSIMFWFSWEWGGWPYEEKRDHLERGPNVCMKTWIQGPVVGPYLHIVVVVTIYPLAHR
jgi:hypothetical protein